MSTDMRDMSNTARKTATDDSEMIGVLGHMDVVPAGDGWNTDPFEGVIADGRSNGKRSPR